VWRFETLYQNVNSEPGFIPLPPGEYDERYVISHTTYQDSIEVCYLVSANAVRSIGVPSTLASLAAWDPGQLVYSPPSGWVLLTPQSGTLLGGDLAFTYRLEIGRELFPNDPGAYPDEYPDAGANPPFRSDACIYKIITNEEEFWSNGGINGLPTFLASESPPKAGLLSCELDGTCSATQYGFDVTRDADAVEPRYVKNFKARRQVGGEDIDSDQVLVTWDWGKPGYCQEQLLSLGFSLGDLTP
jgi:hypothetical protein